MPCDHATQSPPAAIRSPPARADHNGPVTSSDDERAALERNLRLIPVHIALSRSLVWISVMVLFTRARFDLDGALVLSSIYYFSVVVLEVPSGWMSDRLGRVVTVRVAAASWIVSHILFLVGDDTFWVIALAQFFLAGGFASLSGTDVTLHFDTLESLGLDHEFARREARVSSLAYVATAASDPGRSGISKRIRR